MSEYKTKILLGAVLAVIIATGLAVAAISLGPQLGTGTSQNSTTGSTSTSVLGPSVLLVQLTDPPIVPFGTTSLNLTYTSIDLLVTEPSTTTTNTTTTTSSLVTAQTVSITPTGGNATVNLLSLQNISQTIASANLSSGSTIYSVSFNVSNISIEINGTSYSVTLATGGNTLLVTLTNPAILTGTNALLIDLNPTIISTPTGYQMIPSSIGIIKPQSEITSNEHNIGSKQNLSDQDQNELHQASGQVTASLIGLSVSGNKTTITVQVNNTGSSEVQLVGIGVNGNFTVQDQFCGTTATTTTNTSSHEYGDFGQQRHCQSFSEVVFIPSMPSTTSTTTTSSTENSSCISGQLNLVTSPVGVGQENNNKDNYYHHVSIAPGECVTLTFSGTISFGFGFGHTGSVLVPSTLSGQTYTIHVIASHSAEMKLSCTLPLPSNSCTASSQNGKDYQSGEH